MRYRILAPMLALSALACSSYEPVIPDPPQPGPLTLTIVPGGDNQSAVAGERLARPLEVEVRRDGIPQADIPVKWSAENGTLTASSSFTNRQGIASARWTLGSGEGLATARAALYESPGTTVEFRAERWPVVGVYLVMGAGQVEGEVGAQAPFPYVLSVRKVTGAPAVGIPVEWSTATGMLSGQSMVTDESGLARTSWILGQTAGAQYLTATIRGHRGLLTFVANARPAPAATIEVLRSPTAWPANFRAIAETVRVRVSDRFGNLVPGIDLLWSIIDGPAVLLPTSITPTNSVGVATGAVRPTGTAGAGTVLVRVAETAAAATIPFAFTEPIYGVRHDGAEFISFVNGSRPAVDTIPVGATMTWIQTPFDYELHAVESVGSLLFAGGGDFPYANPSQVKATFTSPGTYQYRDPWTRATGTIVVQ